MGMGMSVNYILIDASREHTFVIRCRGSDSSSSSNCRTTGRSAKHSPCWRPRSRRISTSHFAQALYALSLNTRQKSGTSRWWRCRKYRLHARRQGEASRSARWRGRRGRRRGRRGSSHRRRGRGRGRRGSGATAWQTWRGRRGRRDRTGWHWSCRRRRYPSAARRKWGRRGRWRNDGARYAIRSPDPRWWGRWSLSFGRGRRWWGAGSLGLLGGRLHCLKDLELAL